MLCAIRLGVHTEQVRSSSAPRPLDWAPPSDAHECSLEGVMVGDPEFEPSAVRLASEFIRQYVDATPDTRLGLVSPLFPPLFDQDLSQEEKSRVLSRIFSLAAQRLIMSDYRRFRQSSIQFNTLLRIAQEVGSANFCELSLDSDSIPQQATLVASTHEHRLLPPGAKLFHLPLNWGEALQTLRRIRKEHPAALTRRLVIENIFRSNQVGRARRLCQRIRSLFCGTDIAVVVNRDFRLANMLKSLQRKFHFEVLLLRDPRPPTALQDNFPGVLRSL